jgi:cytochrome c553
MNKLKVHQVGTVVLALACLGVGTSGAAEISLPPVPTDPSQLPARQLVSFACSKCHGVSGNGVSISPIFPILAGQNAVYTEAQLKLLRQRGRADPHARAFMWGISRGLSDEEIDGLATYFESMPAVTGRPSTNPELAAKGKDIYENGVPEPHKVVKCAQCHGDVGAGTNNVPRLAGQHKGYIALQLHYYHDELRENKLMNRNVKNITDEQIDAVTEYISTLTP